jgi:tetratricopeptide (TPR) repeat protein
MQNGRDDSVCREIDPGRGMSADLSDGDRERGRSDRKPCCQFRRSILLGTAALLTMWSAGCGSRGGSPFTDRATESHRADRIEVLRTKSQQQPGDARVWQELGTELLRKSGSLVQVNDRGIGSDEMMAWPKVERVFDEAIHAFENALQLDSTDAHLFALAGHAYLTKFQMDPVVNDTVRVTKAISLLERSIRLNPQLVDAHIDLALASTPSWRCEGDMKLAKAHLAKAFSLSPDDGMAYDALSRILEVEENYPEALSALRKAFDLGLREEVEYLEMPVRYQRIWWHVLAGDDLDTTKNIGFLARGLAQVTRMYYRLSTPIASLFQIGVYRKADQLGLRNSKFYEELSRSYAGLGRKEKGFDFVMRAFELDSLSVGPYSYWYWWNYPDSIWIDQFLKRMPPGSYYGNLLAAAKYRNLGRADSSTAQKLLQTAMRLQPGYGAAYVQLGQWYVNEPLKAKDLFEKASTLEFHEPSSMITAAQQLSAQGYFDLAFRYYKRILGLELAPRILVLKMMGMAYEQKKDRQAAYAKYIEMDRASPNAILSSWLGYEAAALMGYAYADRGDYDRAIEILKRSIGNERWRKTFRYYGESSDPKRKVEIGQLYSKKGDSENALAFYRQALKDDPEFPEAHFGLGEEYAKTNFRDKAIESYRRAAKLGVPTAKEALQKLGETVEAQVKQ